ncbi:hypothetical protein [Streptomyces sp. cg35]|uniref:hypothetical protein n=1 Tax=Streptomyces sp. cg35 TaxID=3421650 RepID=UPI003D1679A0
MEKEVAARQDAPDGRAEHLAGRAVDLPAYAGTGCRAVLTVAPVLALNRPDAARGGDCTSVPDDVAGPADSLCPASVLAHQISRSRLECTKIQGVGLGRTHAKPEALSRSQRARDRTGRAHGPRTQAAITPMTWSTHR